MIDTPTWDALFELLAPIHDDVQLFARRIARSAAEGDDGARWADDHASAQRATAALATLEPAQREAIVLFELHGYSIEEIAEIQRASVPAVKSRLVHLTYRGGSPWLNPGAMIPPRSAKRPAASCARSRPRARPARRSPP